MLWFPSLEEVYRFHEIQIHLYGGSHGVRDRGLVESALLAPQQTFGGEELYPKVSDKAAALWHGLVCNHGFVDGNKRIGLMVVSIFLIKNGYDLNLSSDLAEAVTMRLAEGQWNRGQLTSFLAEHVTPTRETVMIESG